MSGILKRNDIMFRNICNVMKEKSQKYWKYILHLFVFIKVLDPTIEKVQKF